MPEHDNDGRHSCSNGTRFTDNLWGKRVRALVESVQWLKGPNWDQIEAHASIHFQGADHDNEETGGDAGITSIGVYAQIEIDWCVL
jgi:hypothetical protein